MKYILKYFLLNLIQLWLPHPKFRAIYLRRLGAQIGKNVRVERVKFIQIQHSISNLILKDYAFIGTDVIIDLSDKTIIGERSIVAPRCTLLTHQDFGYFNGNGISKIIPKKFAPLIMEEDVVISADSTILSGVTLSSYSVVAAKSLVTKDVPTKSLVGGIPAKELRKLSQ